MKLSREDKIAVETIYDTLEQRAGMCIIDHSIVRSRAMWAIAVELIYTWK